MHAFAVQPSSLLATWPVGFSAYIYNYIYKYIHKFEFYSSLWFHIDKKKNSICFSLHDFLFNFMNIASNINIVENDVLK